MDFKSEKVKGLHHAISFTIPEADFEKEALREYEVLQKKIKLNGFRKGHAPLETLKKMYGDHVQTQIWQTISDKVLKDYCTNKKVRLAASAKLDIQEDKKGTVLSLDFDVLPSLEDIDFEKIKLEKESLEITDKEVDDSLKNLAESRRETKKIETNRITQKVDIVVIDFEGFIEGIAFENGKASRQFLELGSNSFIPGFEDALLGKKLGKTEIQVVFPKDYGAKHLAGKKAVFKIELHEIREKILPEINDELAKAFGLKDLTDLKQTILSQLEKQAENDATAAVKDKLLEALTEKVKLDLPEVLVNQEEDLIKKSNPEIKEKEIRKQAEQRVKLGLILGEVGKKLNVRVSQAEMRQALIQEAMRTRHPDMQKLIKDFDKNPNQFSGLYAMIFEDKVLTEILGKIKLTEKKIKGKK